MMTNKSLSKFIVVVVHFQEYPTHRVRLQQCQICGRKFNTESLVRERS